MGLISNLDFSKATEERRDLEDGTYEVEIGKCYNRTTNNAGPRAFTEYKVLEGPKAGVEAAQRQAFNNMTASTLAGIVAAALGFNLTIPTHKQAFDNAYPQEKLKVLCDEIWEGKNNLILGKRATLTIKTGPTKSGQSFRKHTWTAKTA